MNVDILLNSFIVVDPRITASDMLEDVYALRLLCTIYMLLSLAVQWIVAWVAQVVFIAIAYPFTTKETRQDICGHIFRVVSWIGVDVLNPFWHAHVLNEFPETKNKRVILMMNHLSSADPFMSIRSMRPRDGSWVAKSGLFKVPLGGWAMANAGDLRVHFKNKQAGFATVKGTVALMIEEARKKLRRGRMLCVFPEGVRNMNPEGPLGPFRLGFFSLAVEENAVIVPLAISGTQKLWPRGSAVMSAAHSYYSFGEPIEASKFSSAEKLAEHTREVIDRLRFKHPDMQGKAPVEEKKLE